MQIGVELFALLVPLSVIIGILVSKNVFFSLGLGIICGGIMVNLDHLSNLPFYLYDKLYHVFFSENQVIWDKFYMIGFLLSLGVLGEIVLKNGGIGAFGIWMKTHIKKAKHSEFALFALGILLFIDGLFNAVVLGQIAKPLHKIYSISKARLAYIVDSTSSPICAIVPFSSWGAYIVGILQSNLEKGENAFFVFLQSIAYNFYAWLTLACVFLVILLQHNPSSTQIQSSQEEAPPSSPLFLLFPFCSLVFFILAIAISEGYAQSHSFDLMLIFGSADMGKALFWGGCITLVLSFLLSLKVLPPQTYGGIFKQGIKVMLSVVGILILAWALGPILKEDLKIASLVSHAFSQTFRVQYGLLLPAFLFLTSILISFSTGTSWGCFAIMLPIGISLALEGGGNVALAVASVLSGSVYGDHTSLISDTTILSASSVGCKIQEHFSSQFFFASLCAFCSLIAFVLFAWSENLWLSFGVGGGCLVILLLMGRTFLQSRFT